MKNNPVLLLGVQLQDFRKMPGNGFSFAVFVSGENHGGGFFHFIFQGIHFFSGFFIHDVFRLEIIFNVNAHFLLGKVANMAKG